MSIESLRKKAKQIKLVVFDLDGTLLKSNHLIASSSLSAIDALRQKGIKIAIASGRIVTMLGMYVHILKDVDYLISVNGGSIDDMRNSLTISRRYVPAEETKHIIKYCLDHHLDCCLLTRTTSYFPQYSHRIQRFKAYNSQANQLGLPMIDFKYYDHSLDEVHHIEKILIQEIDTSKSNLFIEYIKQFSSLSHTTSDRFLIDISEKGISKGNAITSLARHMNISVDQVCSFGDYDNDISMFDVSGIAIAMGNASDSVQKKSDYVTRTNDDDGIYHAIQDIFNLDLKL